MEIGLGIFAVVLANLAANGFYGFVLPWVLTFTLTFVAMTKTGLSSNFKVAGVIALCVAFMLPLIKLFGISVGQWYVLLFGTGSVLLAGILMALLVFAMLGMTAAKAK